MRQEQPGMSWWKRRWIGRTLIGTCLAVALLCIGCDEEGRTPLGIRRPNPRGVEVSDHEHEDHDLHPEFGTGPRHYPRRRPTKAQRGNDTLPTPETTNTPNPDVPETTDESSSEADAIAAVQAAAHARLVRQIQTVLPSPTTCIEADHVAALDDSLTLTVRLHIRPTGMITSARVGSTALTRDERRCIEDQLEDLNLPGSVDAAHRRFEAELIYNVGAPTTASEAAAEPSTTDR